MLKHRFLFPLITIVLIFLTYTSLNPLAKLLPTGEEDYILNTKGMNIHHRPPLFYVQENGVFFVHPATKSNAKGSFTFKKDEELYLDFSIQQGSPTGKVQFIVKKNGKFENKFLVDTKHNIQYRLSVNNGDILTIIADPLGSTAGDWGNVKVSKYEPHYILKLRLIPFLWAMFFIFLMGKGHFYIALNSYIGFLLTLIAEKITFGALPFSDTVAYTGFYFFLAFLFTLIYQELYFLKKFKIAIFISWSASILLYAVPISFIAFALVYGKPIDWNILFAIYQTNPNEAVEYIESFIPLSYLFMALVFTLMIGYILWCQEMKERQIIERSLLMLVIIFLATFLSISFLDTRMPHLIYDSFTKYNANIERLIDFQKKQRAAIVDINATKKKEKGETYVVVIGESLNKYNMGLYNHFRNTTPNLLQQKEKNDLLVFDNAYSNDGCTMGVLSFALTEANQYNNIQYFNAPSFIEIFNKAGFDTYWLSRQGILNANLVSVIAHEAKNAIDLVNDFHVDTDSSIYEDERVIRPFKKVISQTNKNRLIVIHLYGNHFRYQDRYSTQFEKYKSTPPYLIATNKSLYLDDYAAYDNSVLFNDYVVNSVLHILQKHGGVSALLYFSDHGEDVVRHNGHASTINSFTYEMGQIPLIVWLSPEYKKRYPNIYNTLQRHKDSLFSNDMIYETLIGMAHIKTNHYNPKYDLSSVEYNLTPVTAYTLHGKLHYTGPKNYIYWRKSNAQFLYDKPVFKKIVVNNTDSVGKLNDAWQLGFRSFKLNLYYMSNKKAFQTGTDKYDTGGTVIDLLGYFKVQEIKNLLFDLVNLHENNSQEILKRLELLDQKLQIKKKSILVISQKKLSKYFSKNGWKVALKTKSIFEKDDSENIAYVIDSKQFQDSNEYKPIVQLIIDHAFNIADSKLTQKIKHLKFVDDPQISFLLVDFASTYTW